MTTELEKKTRAVFHKIHSRHLEDSDSYTRLRKLITTDYLGVEPDYFRDKVCADLGCGSSVHGTFNLLNLGAKYVQAMDLDESIIEPATRTLSAVPEFAGRWQLDTGSLMDLPYEDEQFDFVLCQGVIQIVEDEAKALDEIYRVLKPGGQTHLLTHGRSGLIYRIVMETMRDEYRENPLFARIVDEERPEVWLKKEIAWLREKMDDDGSPAYRKSLTLLDCLADLMDNDFFLTLKDRMQSPLYKGWSEDEFGRMLKAAGFTAWRRVSRQPEYNNIRKIVAPLYHDYQSDLARLLYGEGMPGYVVTK